MDKAELEKKKVFIECKKKAIGKIKECYHPKCNKNSINSHILQKNGILSSISHDNHLWEVGINLFASPIFIPEKRGINQIFSFNCFCKEHDNKLFAKIEDQEIDFNDYESCLLFSVRTKYNEVFRKQVGIDQYECIIKRITDSNLHKYLKKSIEQMKLALEDFKYMERKLWEDLEKNTESFVFEVRFLKKQELILSSFFDYETSEEILKYQQNNHGKNMERLSPIFVSLFPYQDDSVLIMGYLKEDEKKVKSYVNKFVKESEKKVQRRLTNLLLFQCENWVCSNTFYLKKLKGYEDLIADTMKFSMTMGHERKCYDINIFSESFHKKLIEWNNKHNS
jgi:hypothetical protein